MAAHANEAPEPLTTRRPDVPAELSRIVMRCLAKPPAERPQSATLLVQVLSGGPPKPVTSSPLSRIPVWVPWLLAALSTATAIALALTRK